MPEIGTLEILRVKNITIELRRQTEEIKENSAEEKTYTNKIHILIHPSVGKLNIKKNTLLQGWRG